MASAQIGSLAGVHCPLRGKPCRRPVPISKHTYVVSSRHNISHRSLSCYFQRPQFRTPTSRSRDLLSSDAGSLGIVIVDHGSKRSASNDMLHEFVEVYK